MFNTDEVCCMLGTSLIIWLMTSELINNEFQAIIVSWYATTIRETVVSIALDYSTVCKVRLRLFTPSGDRTIMPRSVTEMTSSSVAICSGFIRHERGVRLSRLSRLNRLYSRASDSRLR